MTKKNLKKRSFADLDFETKVSLDDIKLKVIKNSKFVSVIIPFLNEEVEIESLLKDISKFENKNNLIKELEKKAESLFIPLNEKR